MDLLFPPGLAHLDQRGGGIAPAAPGGDVADDHHGYLPHAPDDLGTE